MQSIQFVCLSVSVSVSSAVVHSFQDEIFKFREKIDANNSLSLFNSAKKRVRFKVTPTVKISKTLYYPQFVMDRHQTSQQYTRPWGT